MPRVSWELGHVAPQTDETNISHMTNKGIGSTDDRFVCYRDRGSFYIKLNLFVYA